MRKLSEFGANKNTTNTIYDNRIPFRDVLRLQYFFRDLKNAKKMMKKDVTRMSAPFIPVSSNENNLFRSYNLKRNSVEEGEDLAAQANQFSPDNMSFENKVDLVKAKAKAKIDK